MGNIMPRAACGVHHACTPKRMRCSSFVVVRGAASTLMSMLRLQAGERVRDSPLEEDLRIRFATLPPRHHRCGEDNHAERSGRKKRVDVREKRADVIQGVRLGSAYSYT